MAIQARPILRVFNGVGRMLRRRGWQIPRFDPDRLEQTARKRTGLSDFGSPRYREPLARLCRSYTEDPELTLFGRVFVREMLITLLKNRLQIAKSLSDDPGIRQEEVRRPLFVLGLPRTGTTLLFNLLAQDPAARPLMIWESMHPAPPPRPETYQTDPRIATCRYRINKLHQALPELANIHEFAKEGPEECLGLLMNAFLSPFFRGRIPYYRDWLDEIDDAEVDAAYAEYKEQLQILQRHVKGSHWILKCPSHLYGLGSILRTFPDAAVVHTHRDLARSVPSLLSLSETFEELCYHPVNREMIGQTMLRAVGQLLDRGLQGRDAADPEGRRVLDINFQDTVGNPLGTVERIYAHFGYPFTPEFRERVERFLAEDAKRRHGLQHRYTVEQYGLTAEELRNRFRAYSERFHIPQDA
jgi:hypothetical protein